MDQIVDPFGSQLLPDYVCGACNSDSNYQFDSSAWGEIDECFSTISNPAPINPNLLGTTENFEESFLFPDVTGYPYSDTSSPSVLGDCVHNLPFPIEKTMKPKLILSKDMELKVNSAEYDQHINDFIRRFGPLSVTDAKKVKDQRRRIRNRESAQMCRKKKRNLQQNLHKENESLRIENQNLKKQLEILKKDILQLKQQVRNQESQLQQRKQDPQEQRSRQQKQLAQSSQVCQCSIRIHQNSDIPPLEEDQSLQVQPQLWRINAQPANLRPFVLTSFIVLFTFILFIPHFPTSFSISPISSSNFTRDDFHMKKVTVNPQSNALELVPTNAAFPSFYPSNMIGGGGRALLMVDDFNEPNVTMSDADSDSNYAIVEPSGLCLEDMELTYVLLAQSPQDIERAYNSIENEFIDILVPSEHEGSVIHITSKIIDQQLIPGSSSYFPTISSETVYSYSQ